MEAASGKSRLRVVSATRRSFFEKEGLAENDTGHHDEEGGSSLAVSSIKIVGRLDEQPPSKKKVRGGKKRGLPNRARLSALGDTRDIYSDRKRGRGSEGGAKGREKITCRCLSRPVRSTRRNSASQMDQGGNLVAQREKGILPRKNSEDTTRIGGYSWAHLSLERTGQLRKAISSISKEKVFVGRRKKNDGGKGSRVYANATFGGVITKVQEESTSIPAPQIGEKATGLKRRNSGGKGKKGREDNP